MTPYAYVHIYVYTNPTADKSAIKVGPIWIRCIESNINDKGDAVAVIDHPGTERISVVLSRAEWASLCVSGDMEISLKFQSQLQ